MTGWETAERVLESGGFESRQRVLVAEPVVEASEAGARARTRTEAKAERDEFLAKQPSYGCERVESR